MIVAMFVLALISLAFFAAAVAAAFKVGPKHMAVTGFGLIAVLVGLALSVLAIITFFVGA
jgi:hypothetical protein